MAKIIISHQSPIDHYSPIPAVITNHHYMYRVRIETGIHIYMSMQIVVFCAVFVLLRLQIIADTLTFEHLNHVWFSWWQPEYTNFYGFLPGISGWGRQHQQTSHMRSNNEELWGRWREAHLCTTVVIQCGMWPVASHACSACEWFRMPCKMASWVNTNYRQVNIQHRLVCSLMGCAQPGVPGYWPTAIRVRIVFLNRGE